MSVKIVAVILRGGLRYEKDLAPHFLQVAFWNIFPHRNETDASRIKWASRVLTNE